MDEIIKKLLGRLHSNSVYGSLITSGLCIIYDSQINLITIGGIDEIYKRTIETMDIDIVHHADKQIDIQFYISNYNMDIIHNTLYISSPNKFDYINIPINNKELRVYIK